MEFIKKLRNIIIVLTLVTIMIIATSPITVLGASDKNVPVITAYQNGGQLKPGQEIKFKIKDDTKISYIFYAWDRRTQGNGYETFKLPNEQSEYEYTVKAPMTTGLHEFSIAAQDQYGNISYWLNIPYTIVNEVSEVVDNTKPTLIFDTENGKYPYHESTISQEMPITLQAQDDSGIYYIAYKWTREIVQNDTGATLVFNKTNSKSFTTEITAPVESGDWFLLVYARDGANNVSNTYATKVTIKATDYTKLKEKLDSIKNTLIESDYENFEELQNAIAEANNMISQNKSSQKTVDAQLTKIESAIKNLQAKAVNRQELDNYINSLVSTDYKNWAELQRLITDAQDKSVTLQSEFNKRLQKVKEFSLEAKEIDTSKLDTLKQELAKLDKNDYTEKSWNEIQTKISNAEQQTLQSKFDKIVNEISLEILVKLPKITNVSSNPKYVAAESQVTISFETNMELNIESSTASINGKAILGKIEKVEENKYKFTYTVTSDDEVKGSISYAIKPVADNKGEEVEGKEVTGEISIADYITGIEITRPTKLQYEVDDIEMDLSEGKVTPIMASGKPQEAVDMNIEMISGFDTSSDGTKTITVTYKEQTATFEIQVLKKEISKNEFTLSSLEVDYDGTEKTVEITPTDGVGAVTEVKYYPIISEHEQEALEGKPVNAGKYAVKVSVKEGRKYKAINDFSIGTLTILQATPEYEVPKGLTAIYGKKLKDIQLPDKFTFQDDQETEVGTVGEHTFKVKYTPEDIKNYKIIENIDVIVTVIKAVPEYTAPQGLTAIYGQTLEDVKITDSKFKFQDELTTPVGDVGENTFLVTYTPEDTHNYEIVRDIEVTITVLKASAPEIIYPTSTPIIYGQKLENSELVGGSIEYGTFAWQSSSFVPPAGTNNYIVIFTPNENTIKNYEEISVKQREIAIEVEKATYDMSDVKFEGSTITYDGNSHNIKITGKLPEGVTVQYEGNNKRDVGEYTVIAKFTGGEDKENYNEIPNMQATLKITPRTPAKEDLKYTIKSTEYSGKTQGIEVTANDGIQGLGEITVKYNGNIDKPVNVGKYKVTVTIGEGTNYSATEQDIELGEYEITRKAPSKEDLSYSITSTEYTGKAQGIKVTAKDGIKGLGTITVKYNGSTDEPINAGTYKITVSIAEGTNYSATEQDIELENYIITAKTPSKEDLEYNLESKEYTGEEQEIEVTAKEGINGIGTITVKYDDSNNKPKDAKVYTVTVDIAEGTNYSSAQSIELGTFEITKKAPSKEDLKFDLTSKEYTGVEQEVEVTAEEGIEGLGKTITVKYDGDTKKPVNAGTYAITVDIDEGTNYSSVEGLELGDFTITPSKTQLEENNFEIEGKTNVEYDGQQHTIEVKAKDVVLLGTIKVSYYNDSNGEEVEAPTNVGTYTIKVTTEGATNYADVEDLELTTKLEITAVAITVKVDDITAVYGEDKKELTCSKEVTSGTLVGNDQVTDLGIELKTYYNEREEEIEIGPKTPVGTYKIKGESTVYGNYNVTVQDGTYTIEAKEITVKADDKTATYGDKAQQLTFSEVIETEGKTALVNGEKLSILKIELKTYKKAEPDQEQTISETTSVGTYNIKANSKIYGNYNVTVQNGTYTIEAKAITVKADDKESSYGEPAQELTYSEVTDVEGTTSLVNGENLKTALGITLKTYKNEEELQISETTNAGTYAIKGDNGVYGNYNVTVQDGTYTITPSKTQLEENNFEIEGKTNVEYDGQQHTIEVKAKDVVLLGTIKVSYYNDSNGEEVEAPTNVGTYTIKVTTEGATNYADVEDLELTTKLEITAVAITVKVDDITAVYGEDKKELTCSKEVTSGTLVGNDQVTDLGIELKTYYNEREEEIEIGPKTPVGTYKIKGENTVYGNYNVTVQEGTYTITRKTPSGEDLSYDLTDKEYTGKEQEVQVTAREETEGLGTGITVKYNESEDKPKAVGNYNVTVDITEGTNYSAVNGLELGTLKITRKTPTINELQYNLPTSNTYNGKAIPIEVTAKEGVEGLGKITIKYNGESTEPIDAKEYTVTVDISEGDNYSSVTDIELGKYTITQASIEKAEVTTLVEDIVYDGQEKEQKVTSVKLNEVSLIKDSDYTLTITYATYSIEEHKVTSDFTTNKPLDVGTYSVKILVEGIGNYTGSKTAEAIMEIKPIEVDSISITTQPSKLEYRYGETIVTDGGKLEVTYNNKKKETIDITTDMIQGELKSATTLGTQNVTIEYEGQTANYDITVKDYITKIEAKPSKIVYKVGEVFEKDTLEVKVYKASKEGEGDVVLVTDEMLSECNFAVEGQKTITVSYIDNDEQSATKGQVFTATFEIAVVPNETDQQYAMVLNGSSEVHIEVTPENANSYKDEGVTVYKVDDSTSPVEGIVVKTKITALDNGNLEASIDTTKLGKYKITYSTNNADDVTRIVYIEDTTAPVINLNKDIVSNENVDISEEENNNINIKFTREKATFDLDILVSATDNYDTPKNKEIEIIYTVQYNDSELKDIYEIGKETEPGVYVVNYTATDSSGNMSTKSITFTILDYPPTIYYLEELDAETVIKVQLKNGNVYNRYLKIGCDTENVTIRIRVDGKEENDYNGEILKDGTYTVKVVQNEYINSEEITFTIDTIPPKVSVNEETRTITFEDPSDVYKATLTTGDGKTTITIKDGEGNNNIKEDGTYHIDGTGIMVYTLNVEDKYGNAITPIEFILLK